MMRYRSHNNTETTLFTHNPKQTTVGVTVFEWKKPTAHFRMPDLEVVQPQLGNSKIPASRKQRVGTRKPLRIGFYFTPTTLKCHQVLLKCAVAARANLHKLNSFPRARFFSN